MSALFFLYKKEGHIFFGAPSKRLLIGEYINVKRAPKKDNNIESPKPLIKIIPRFIAPSCDIFKQRPNLYPKFLIKTYKMFPMLTSGFEFN